MGVMHDQTFGGGIVWFGALISHPLVLALLAGGLVLYALARKMERGPKSAPEQALARGNTAELTPDVTAVRQAGPALDQIAARTTPTLPPTPAQPIERERPSAAAGILSRATQRIAATPQAQIPGHSSAGRQARAFPDLSNPFHAADASFPADGVNGQGLTQISLRTTPRYRIASLMLAFGMIALVFGTSVFLRPRGDGTLVLHLMGYALCLGTLWHVIWALRWRLDYDSIGLCCRDRFLRPEARMWRALSGITSDGLFITQFHFADGLVMRVPNFILGRRQMMRTAQSWLKNGHAPDRPQ